MNPQKYLNQTMRSNFCTGCVQLNGTLENKILDNIASSSTNVRTKHQNHQRMSYADKQHVNDVFCIVNFQLSQGNPNGIEA